MHTRRALLLAIVMGAVVLATPAHASWRAVCREDVGRLCSPDQNPRGMLQCLQQHRAELSAICARRLPQPKPAGSKPSAGCGADVERFCKDLTGRPAAMLQCLNGHKDDLSAACRDALTPAAPAVHSAAVPCAADVNRFCREVRTQPAARNKCLAEHKSELSEPCRTFLEHPAPPAAPCRADIQRLCKGVGPGGMRKCLTDHDAELSPACRAFAHAPSDPCRDDVVRLCKDVAPGEGRIVACLKQHESEMSPACKQRLQHVPAPKPK